MFQSIRYGIAFCLLVAAPSAEMKALSPDHIQLATQFGVVAGLSFLAGIKAHEWWPALREKYAGNSEQEEIVLQKDQSKTKIGFIEIDLEQHRAWDCLIPLQYLFSEKTIAAIVLQPKGLGDFAGADTIAQMIRYLKKVYPKPIMAYCDGQYLIGSTYLLAAAADAIYTLPTTWIGNLTVLWPLKDISEKNKEEGKEYHFIYKGRFKGIGFPDYPQSQEYLDVAQQTVNTMQKSLVASVNDLRPQVVQDKALWTDGQMYNANEALQLHLIDKVSDKGELFKDILERLGLASDLKLITHETLSPVVLPTQIVLFSDDKKYADEKLGIGILRITSLQQKSSWHYARELEALLDDDVKGVLIAIDEAGCDGALAISFHADILRLKELYKKPIAVYIESVATSGAYVIASAADYIIASSNAQIGCIGVVLETYDYTKKNAKDHTAYTMIKAGKYADLFCRDIPFTEKKKEVLQKIVDADYDHCIDLLKKARPQLASSISQWADAQRFIGVDAVEAGLIDKIGTLFDAFDYIKSAVGHPIHEGPHGLEDINIHVRNTEKPQA